MMKVRVQLAKDEFVNKMRSQYNKFIALLKFILSCGYTCQINPDLASPEKLGNPRTYNKQHKKVITNYKKLKIHKKSHTLGKRLCGKSENL
jgi:hypothetical protein